MRPSKRPTDGTNLQADRAVESAEIFPQAEAQTRTQFQLEDVRPIIEGNKIASGRIRISYEARTDNDTNSCRVPQAVLS